MIIDVRINNSYVFSDKVKLSLKADMRNRKFMTNVYSENNFNILKTIGIYGPNNSGKTCLLKSIRNIREVLLNKAVSVVPNIFTNNPVCSLGITFLEQGRIFNFDFKYNPKSEEYIYERFSEIIRDKYGNEKEIIKVLKDTENEIYKCEDKDIELILPMTANNNILIYLIASDKSILIKEIKNILIGFASKIDFIDMNNIPMEKTIKLLKNKDNMQEKIVNFIRNADVDLENMQYLDDEQIKLNGIEFNNIESEIQEEALAVKQFIMDQIKLVSVYKGVAVPSMFFDSTGTKKIAALASYVVEALEKGKILIVDELDSSIHFKLTRAIVAMFNNELNVNAQLICTVHDINLMDCKKLFRKEQIWFVHKDSESVYLYSLGEFTAERDGIRDTTDIIEKYRKGILGALPEPDMINTLMEVKNEHR